MLVLLPYAGIGTKKTALLCFSYVSRTFGLFYVSRDFALCRDFSLPLPPLSSGSLEQGSLAPSSLERGEVFNSFAHGKKFDRSIVDSEVP